MSFKKFMESEWTYNPGMIESRIANALGPILSKQLESYLLEDVDKYDNTKGRSIRSLVELVMENAYNAGVAHGRREVQLAWSEESAYRHKRMMQFLLSDEAKGMTEHDRQFRALQEFAGIDVPTFKE